MTILRVYYAGLNLLVVGLFSGSITKMKYYDILYYSI